MCHLVSLLETLNRESKQSFVYSTLLSVTDSGYAMKRRLKAGPCGVCYLRTSRIPEVYRHCVSYILRCFPLLSSSAGHANIPHSAVLIGARVTRRFHPVVSVTRRLPGVDRIARRQHRATDPMRNHCADGSITMHPACQVCNVMISTSYVAIHAQKVRTLLRGRSASNAYKTSVLRPCKSLRTLCKLLRTKQYCNRFCSAMHWTLPNAVLFASITNGELFCSVLH